jgi:hypothetical protein
MSALGQKRSFAPDQPNVRFAPKAVIWQCTSDVSLGTRLSIDERAELI